MNEPQKLHQIPTEDLQKFLTQFQQAINILANAAEMIAKVGGAMVAAKEQFTTSANDMLKTAKEVPAEPAETVESLEARIKQGEALKDRVAAMRAQAAKESE